MLDKVGEHVIEFYEGCSEFKPNTMTINLLIFRL
jgi:hypothetical protein